MTVDEPPDDAGPARANEPALPRPRVARVGVLLSVLVLVLAAWVYDYGWARPGVAAADSKVRKLVDDHTHRSVQEVSAITAADIHTAVGREPTWVDRRPEENYAVEYYCWWGRVPL